MVSVTKNINKSILNERYPSDRYTAERSVMSQRILVCGDIRGNFRLLFDRVDKLNKKKGPFDFLLCVGEFFGKSPSNWEPYKSGALKVPLLTYILGPNEEDNEDYYDDPKGSELCSNVYHLGKRGVLTTSGLKIAYVSGVEGGKSEMVNISKKDVEIVRDIAYKGKDASEYLGIDALMTSQWPKNVTNLVTDVKKNIKESEERGSKLLAWLVSELKPRYHFAGLNDIFYERPPYRNRQVNAMKNVHCTRFIALSSLEGKKWMYGAELTPIDRIKKEELYRRTSDETECPYQDTLTNAVRSEQFFFDMNSKNMQRGVKRKRRDDSQSRDAQSKCWFCLAGGQDSQTVIGIGSGVYVAKPKGGLMRRHLMICPIDHLKSSLHLSRTVRNEILEVKKAVSKYFKKSQEVPVFFERYYRTSHLQLNAVPVPDSCANKLNGAFHKYAEKYFLHLVSIPNGSEPEEVLTIDESFLYLELPDGERYYIRCGQDFPLHFARIVLASREILNAGDKIDWRKCALPEEEEQELGKQLREEFAQFYTGD